MHSCAVSLLALHPLDVDDVLLSVHLDHLADLLAFVVSSNHLRENTQESCPPFLMHEHHSEDTTRNTQAHIQPFVQQQIDPSSRESATIRQKSALCYLKSGGISLLQFFSSYLKNKKFLELGWPSQN